QAVLVRDRARLLRPAVAGVGPHPGLAGRTDDARAGGRVRGAALRARRGGGAPLGRRGQGPLGRPAPLRPLRAAADQPAQRLAQVLGVRDSALTAVELRTLNATALPR